MALAVRACRGLALTPARRRGPRVPLRRVRGRWLLRHRRVTLGESPPGAGRRCRGRVCRGRVHGLAGATVDGDVRVRRRGRWVRLTGRRPVRHTDRGLRYGLLPARCPRICGRLREDVRVTADDARGGLIADRRAVIGCAAYAAFRIRKAVATRRNRFARGRIDPSAARGLLRYRRGVASGAGWTLGDTGTGRPCRSTRGETLPGASVVATGDRNIRYRCGGAIGRGTGALLVSGPTVVIRVAVRRCESFARRRLFRSARGGVVGPVQPGRCLGFRSRVGLGSLGR